MVTGGMAAIRYLDFMKFNVASLCTTLNSGKMGVAKQRATGLQTRFEPITMANMISDSAPLGLPSEV